MNFKLYGYNLGIIKANICGVGYLILGIFTYKSKSKFQNSSLIFEEYLALYQDSSLDSSLGLGNFSGKKEIKREMEDNIKKHILKSKIGYGLSLTLTPLCFIISGICFKRAYMLPKFKF